MPDSSRCKTDGCDNRAFSRGYCQKCYHRLWYQGEFDSLMTKPSRREPVPRSTTIMRFIAQVDFDSSDCWEWTGSTNGGGYGSFCARGFSRGAHRASWELFRGAIPIGAEIHHECKNVTCVNPAHLAVIATHAEHRAIDRKTHCSRGHEFSEENTNIGKDGHRYCRTCHRDRERERLRAIRALA